jgi:hypothetical protein
MQARSIKRGPLAGALGALPALFMLADAALAADVAQLTPQEKAVVLSLSPLPPPPHDPTNAVSGNCRAIDFGRNLFFDFRLQAISIGPAPPAISLSRALPTAARWSTRAERFETRPHCGMPPIITGFFGAVDRTASGLKPPVRSKVRYSKILIGSILPTAYCPNAICEPSTRRFLALYRIGAASRYAGWVIGERPKDSLEGNVA